jgi:hypothetical protein
MTVDIIEKLKDLHFQATMERSHYYTGSCLREAIQEIERLRSLLDEAREALSNALNNVCRDEAFNVMAKLKEGK